MGRAKCGDDFKRDAVHPIVDRGYPVSQRLGVSTHSLYGWVKLFFKSGKSGSEDEQATEIRRLKREPMRVPKERDILKRATAYFAKDAR